MAWHGMGHVAACAVTSVATTIAAALVYSKAPQSTEKPGKRLKCLLFSSSHYQDAVSSNTSQPESKGRELLALQQEVVVTVVAGDAV